MAETLLRIFQIVEERGGLSARLKLVQATGITLQQAGEIRDKASLIKQAKKAASVILARDISEMLK